MLAEVIEVDETVLAKKKWPEIKDENSEWDLSEWLDSGGGKRMRCQQRRKNNQKGIRRKSKV